MSGARVISFTEVLKRPPHKDITRVNKYVISQGFACSADLLVSYIGRLGYTYSRYLALNYIGELKKQFDKFCENRKEETDNDYFYDVGGTPLYDEIIALCHSSEFYEQAIKFSPECNFSGELAVIKKLAFTAMQRKEFEDIGQGVCYITEAIHSALKRIGVNPESEINGINKSSIVAMSLMRDIGGIQFYLPKASELERVIKNVDVYIDSYRMKARDVAIKYGISGKSVSLINSRVRMAMKEYEEGKDESK